MKIYLRGQSGHTERINIIDKKSDMAHDNNSKYVIYYKYFLYIILPCENIKYTTVDLSVEFLYFEFSK